MDESEKRSESIRAGGGASSKRQMLSKKEPNKRSTLMNAGMSASRKGLQDQEKSERSADNNHSSFRQPSTNRDTSPTRNLDQDGSSQLTYPN